MYNNDNTDERLRLCLHVISALGTLNEDQPCHNAILTIYSTSLLMVIIDNATDSLNSLISLAYYLMCVGLHINFSIHVLCIYVTHSLSCRLSRKSKAVWQHPELSSVYQHGFHSTRCISHFTDEKKTGRYCTNSVSDNA